MLRFIFGVWVFRNSKKKKKSVRIIIFVARVSDVVPAIDNYCSTLFRSVSRVHENNNIITTTRKCFKRNVSRIYEQYLNFVRERPDDTRRFDPNDRKATFLFLTVTATAVCYIIV